jgi:cysteine-rich repeat protein
MPSDGCSATCTVEQGYTCTGSPQSTCTFTCGNGNVSGNEQCDDGNTTNGDTCSAVCQYEFTPETEPNSVCGTTNGPFNVPFIFDGAITPIADKDLVAFVVPAYADVKVENVFPPRWAFAQLADSRIELRGTDCTSMLVLNDDGGIFACSKVDPATDASARNLAPGTYFAYVEDFLNDGVIAAYKLEVTFTALCGDGLITGSETCDDGNTMSGDGCADNCRVESGFTCMGQPSVCTP